MGPDLIQEIVNEDQRLRLGDRVEARWSKDGYSFRGQGEIVSLTRKRARVRIQKMLEGGAAVDRMREIEIPRIGDCLNWSSERCVRRLSGKGCP